MPIAIRALIVFPQCLRHGLRSDYRVLFALFSLACISQKPEHTAWMNDLCWMLCLIALRHSDCFKGCQLCRKQLKFANLKWKSSGKNEANNLMRLCVCVFFSNSVSLTPFQLFGVSLGCFIFSLSLWQRLLAEDSQQLTVTISPHCIFFMLQ